MDERGKEGCKLFQECSQEHKLTLSVASPLEGQQNISSPAISRKTDGSTEGGGKKGEGLVLGGEVNGGRE